MRAVSGSARRSWPATASRSKAKTCTGTVAAARATSHGVGEAEALLQALEGAGAALVERDQLAVDDEVVGRQMAGGGGDLGEGAR